MELLKFRIKNFRSIQDTGWQPFSADGITVLVGQNESGKSAILDALYLAFGVGVELNEHDARVDEVGPSVALQISANQTPLAAFIEPLYGREASQKLINGVKARKGIVELWVTYAKTDGKIVRSYDFGDGLKAAMGPTDQGASQSSMDAAAAEQSVPLPKQAYDHGSVAGEIWRYIAEFILFLGEPNFLPDEIDIDEATGKLVDGKGASGAANFLAASGTTVEELLENGWRAHTKEAAANDTVNRELAKYWQQTLSKHGTIRINVRVERYPAGTPKAGQARLAFLISESDRDRLYPSQRSTGTKWFLAFFLAMQAALRRKSSVVFLLDEPGAFLHAVAQRDVLNLIKKVAPKYPVLYSTHSPYLIDHDQLHRILAVERDQGDDSSVTVVRTGLHLGASSHLTLAPILDLMGVDLSQQQVIKRSGNVLLEDESASFYFKAICRLVGVGELHFIACNGATKVVTIVDMFVAWGLEFAVLLDGDKAGEKAAEAIRKKYFDSAAVPRRILTLPNGKSVEDLFTKSDFETHVIHESVGAMSNSDAAGKKSKPLLAYSFLRAVEDARLSLDHLSEDTVAAFRTAIEGPIAYFDRNRRE